MDEDLRVGHRDADESGDSAKGCSAGEAERSRPPGPRAAPGDLEHRGNQARESREAEKTGSQRDRKVRVEGVMLAPERLLVSDVAETRGTDIGRAEPGAGGPVR